MRRLVLLAAALGMLAEAVLIAVALFVVGRVISAYSMSMNGADPRAASAGVQILGALLVDQRDSSPETAQRLGS
jgi:hypothetical protein